MVAAKGGLRTSGVLDDALIATARQGGADGRLAYAELVRRHQSRVVLIVRSLLGWRRGDAEDVAQEVFVRAYRAMPRYPEGVPFLAWVRTIAIRLSYNHRRDAQTRQGYEERAAREGLVHHGAHVPEPQDQVSAALDTLSYPFREVLVLRYVEELSIAELGQLLSIGPSAAKMRLLRARDALREALAENDT